jgi:hypothetical protein
MRKVSLKKHIDSPRGNIVDPEADGKRDRQPSPDSMDLAELVWKYFEADIREALIEVQESMAKPDADTSQD